MNRQHIDLKSFNDTFYKKICGARLQPVLDNIKRMKKAGIWVEITTLLIPGKNDSKEELKAIANFLVSVDKNIPWHISRFYPLYKMQDVNITPIEKIHEAVKIGKAEGLNYVYSGNVLGDRYENTCCSKCDKIIIKRTGYEIIIENKNKECDSCGTRLDIIN